MEKSETYTEIAAKLDYIQANIRTLQMDEIADLEVELSVLRTSLGEQVALAEKVYEDSKAYRKIVYAEKWKAAKLRMGTGATIKDVEMDTEIEMAEEYKTEIDKEYQATRLSNLQENLLAVLNALKDKLKALKGEDFHPNRETGGELG